VFKLSHEERKAGMAGNVRVNLEALGREVDYLHGLTSTKTRLIDTRFKQHLVRIDDDAITPFPITIESKLPNYDAIVISDYDKGTVSYELVEELLELSIPIFIDTKKTNLERFQGAWVKINDLEYSKVKSECTGLIITHGGDGATVPHHGIAVPAVRVAVSDVCGAGDTFLSALAFKWCETQDIKQAVQFATRASSITVQHLGCYAPTLKEIE